MALDIENLMESRQFNDFLFDNLTSAIFLADKDMKIKRVNSSYKTLFNQGDTDSLEKLCGNAMGCAFAVESGAECGKTSHCSECTLRGCIVNSFAQNQSVLNTYISRQFYINGKPVQKYLRMKMKQVTFQNEEVSIVAIDDVTELELEKQKVRDMANRDYLTGLYNRRYFFEIGQNYYDNARRENLVFSVAMIDIDFFKKINNSQGHEAGDFVLKSFSHLMKTHFRQSDIIARFGGEEFCLLLSFKDDNDALYVCEKFRLQVEQEAFVFNGIRIPVTISCGVMQQLGSSFEDMIRKADQALYQAKNAGRNQCLLFRE